MQLWIGCILDLVVEESYKEIIEECGTVLKDDGWWKYEWIWELDGLWHFGWSGA